MDVAASMAGSATPTERPGWWSTIGAVLAGSITAFVCCLAALFTAGALNLLPFDNTPRSHGWPYPVDSAWAVLADVGPMLAVGFAFAGTTCWYLSQKTGVHPRRWPLALVAAAVGWFPLDGEQHGFLLVGGGAAFAVVVIAARGLSLAERRPMPWSRPLVAALAAIVVVLGGVSISYGTLHPLSALDSGTTDPTTLRAKGPTELTFVLENEGLASVRIRELRLVGAPGLDLGRVRVDDPDRRVAPTIDELRPDLPDATLAPDRDLLVYVSVSADCGPHARRASWTLDALDVRLRTAGLERTQRVALDRAQRVVCR
jgi:uncharacterized membrane protein YjjB (DUF3815 family)